MSGRGAAGVAVMVLAAWCQAAAAGQVLSGDQIRQRLIGNTVSGMLDASEGGPSPYAEYYDPDGTIRGDGYTGRWTIEGDTICLSFEDSPRACWQVSAEGDDIEWILDGRVEGNGKVTPGNPNRF
ncbi:MAG: hypothetical protein IRY94_09740 [Rhodospirillaceae bacterium]|nr:hypothetical protein [Rhodospirillaceae bacterium]